jgi:16S rRNA (guanine966-N2)-methyltransferase
VTRIVAGLAKGRGILVPPGRTTRPTSDRAREGLFSTIEALAGSLEGSRVLDLYAGSGAFGLEALSRGAAHALFVENDAKAVAVLRRNIDELALAGAQVRAERVEHLPASKPHQAFDLVLADPPYSTDAGAVRNLLEGLIESGWVCHGAIIAIERATRDAPWVWPDGIEPERERRYGEGTLWYGRRAAG